MNEKTERAGPAAPREHGARGCGVGGDPFHVQGPALVSVSGGRSSGLMLARILGAYGGRLPDDVVCMFANTGEEAEGTLSFVHEMAERWNVRIRWVEFAAERNPLVSKAPWSRWREVTYCTASRKGEPFDALVEWKRYLPNHTQKLCTEWLKVRAMGGLMSSLGYTPSELPARGFSYVPGDFDQVIGIRADEARRIKTHAARPDVVLPLADAGILVGDVAAFWAVQPFDLRIPAGEGNCRMCFEKGAVQLVNVVRDAPDGAGVERWIAREQNRGAQMHQRHSYEQIAAKARRELPLWEPPTRETDGRPCMCGD